MKRWIAALFLLAVAKPAIFAQAQTSQPATQNIVTVSFNAAVLQTTEAQRELSALQAKFAPRQAPREAQVVGRRQVRDVRSVAGLRDGQQRSQHWALATRTKSTWPRRTKRRAVVTPISYLLGLFYQD